MRGRQQGALELLGRVLGVLVQPGVVHSEGDTAHKGCDQQDVASDHGYPGAGRHADIELVGLAALRAARRALIAGGSRRLLPGSGVRREAAW